MIKLKIITETKELTNGVLNLVIGKTTKYILVIEYKQTKFETDITSEICDNFTINMTNDGTTSSFSLRSGEKFDNIEVIGESVKKENYI